MTLATLANVRALIGKHLHYQHWHNAGFWLLSDQAAP
jgi:hypothetical protein